MSDERLYEIVSNYKTNKKMQARKITKEMNGCLNIKLLIIKTFLKKLIQIYFFSQTIFSTFKKATYCSPSFFRMLYTFVQ